MLERLLPARFDNRFRGWPPAGWLLWPIVGLRLVIGFNSAADPRRIASTADGIPLDRFGAEAAQAATALFALLGLWGLVFAGLGLLILVRYRSMIPLFYLLMLLQMAGARILDALHPIAQAGGASGRAGDMVVITLWTLTLAGLAGSLWGKGYAPGPAPAPDRS